MPLSTAEKTALVATAQALTDEVNALVVDPAVNPLQAPLDAANAALVAANATIAAMTVAAATFQAKIDAAKAALAAAAAADVVEDQRHADAVAALG